MEHRDIARLVKRASKGDNEAFAALYQELFDKCYYLALKISHSPDDAPDIVQEVMISIYNNISKLKNERAFVAYANKVVYGKSIDFLRAKKRWNNSDDFQLLPAEETNDDFIPEAYLLSQENREKVIEAIDSLSDNLRVIILMYYYEQLKTPEIARLLDLEENAVRTRLSRARSNIKRSLECDEKKHTAIFPMLILSRIISADADAFKAPEMKAEIWSNICVETGITLAAGTAIGASVAGTTASSSAGAASAGLTATIKTMIAVTAVTAAVAAGAVVFMPDNDNPDNLSEVAASPTINMPTKDPDYSTIIVDDPEVPLGDAEPSTDVAPPDTEAGDVPAGQPQTAVPAAAPSFTIENSILTYTVGTQLTDEQIIADSGAKGANTERALQVLALGEVDTAAPGEYYIYIILPEPVVEGQWQQVVTIVVEEEVPDE